MPIYVPEARSGDADEILTSATTVVVSDLTVSEVHVSLVRRVKIGTLQADHEQVIRSLFEQHLTADVLRRVALRSDHCEMAGQLAQNSPVILRTLDALHLVIATELRATVGTFDRRMAEAARGLGLEVVG